MHCSKMAASSAYRQTVQKLNAVATPAACSATCAFIDTRPFQLLFLTRTTKSLHGQGREQCSEEYMALGYVLDQPAVCCTATTPFAWGPQNCLPWSLVKSSVSCCRVLLGDAAAALLPVHGLPGSLNCISNQPKPGLQYHSAPQPV